MSALLARALAVRILRWYWKLAYIAAACLVIGLTGLAFRGLGGSGVPLDAVLALLTLGLVAYAARIFRGPNEPLVAARPWWQFTARRTASRRLGMMWVAVAVLIALDGLLIATNVQRARIAAPNEYVDDAFSVAQFVTLAIAYLNSARQLPPVLPLGRSWSADSPLATKPVFELPAEISTMRHKVASVDLEVFDLAASGLRAVKCMLIHDITDSGVAVWVQVARQTVGTLTATDTTSYGPLFVELGRPMAVNALRTGDQLWIDLPDVGDFSRLAAADCASRPPDV